MVSHVTSELTRSQRLQFAATPDCVGPGGGMAPGMELVMGFDVDVATVVLGTKPTTDTQIALPIQRLVHWAPMAGFQDTIGEGYAVF